MSQPTYGSQPAYGAQPAYGSQPGYGSQPSAGSPQYGTQSPWGSQQPSYGQPRSYGPGGQPWAPPGGTPPKKSSTTLIALIVAGVLVVAGIGVALWFGLRGNDGATDTGTDAGGIPAATQEPIGLGSDPVMDGYARDCYDGDMGACDDLFMESPSDSAYETYGGTCAGRQPVAVSDQIFCVDAFGD
jgi:Pericardin like repeat